jgi:hypothetical protein
MECCRQGYHPGSCRSGPHASGEPGGAAGDPHDPSRVRRVSSAHAPWKDPTMQPVSTPRPTTATPVDEAREAVRRALQTSMDIRQ